MPLAPADLRIDARWMLPMSVRDLVLERHSLMVRDGRILEVLPTQQAAERYSASVTLTRGSHMLLPGMVNADTRGSSGSQSSLVRAIAQMLKSGVTSCLDRRSAPDAAARAAQDQGIRILLGLPVAETATPWAKNAAECLSRALALRDEYWGHPLVTTAFAPRDAGALTDATFTRLATLADELEAGITLDVNACLFEIDKSTTEHGLRPLERLYHLGVLTPALNAVHMTAANAADIELAQRTGISVTLCPQTDLSKGWGLPPAAAVAEARIRHGLGSGDVPTLGRDVWGEMKLLALMLDSASLGSTAGGAWDALAAATRGGATILGLDDEVGTLEPGKWADLCCVDLESLGERTHEPMQALVYAGSPELVTDVWVAGRQLLSQRELTRSSWPRPAELEQ